MQTVMCWYVGFCCFQVKN